MSCDQIARTDIEVLRQRQGEDFEWLKKRLEKLEKFLDIKYKKIEEYEKIQK